MSKVSVIMAIYNCKDTVADSIESILNQTYTDWELIMCDDGSTDNTYEIACKYRDQLPMQILVLKNEFNLGLPATLNKCLACATGELVARMDGDDISVETRFEKQVKYLQDNPKLSVVGTSMIRFNDDFGEFKIEHAQSNPDKYTIRYRVPFCHATIMMRKSAYQALGGYTVAKRTVRGQDVDLWLRFYELGYEGNNMDEPLYKMRVDMKTVSRRKLKYAFYAAQTLMIGFRKLKFPLKYYIFALKPLVAAIIPKKIMYQYHKIHS